MIEYARALDPKSSGTRQYDATVRVERVHSATPVLRYYNCSKGRTTRTGGDLRSGEKESGTKRSRAGLDVRRSKRFWASRGDHKRL